MKHSNFHSVFYKRIALILSMCLFLSILPVPDVVLARAYRLNKTTLRLSKGYRYTLRLKPATAAKAVKWKSSKTSIATVSKKGVVKAKKAGKTIVTAIYKKKSYRCYVTVVSIQPKSTPVVIGVTTPSVTPVPITTTPVPTAIGSVSTPTVTSVAVPTSTPTNIPIIFTPEPTTTTSPTEPPLTESFFTIVDVGQGSAAVFYDKNISVIVDTGNGSTAYNNLQSVIKVLQIPTIDYLIISHPDADHCGNVDELCRDYDVKHIWLNRFEKDTATYRTMMKAITDEKAIVTYPETGDHIQLDDTTCAQVLSANEGDANDSNARGLVVRLVSNEHSLLLMGDAPQSIEKQIMSKFNHPTEHIRFQSDIFTVGHHGSNTSSCPDFIEAMSKCNAIPVISVGAGNTYGHPTQNTLNTLLKYMSHIYRTDQDGTLIWYANSFQSTWTQPLSPAA